MMCGVREIDVADWEASTEYTGGFESAAPTVRHFWAAVHTMATAERNQLLVFCTGSARLPAAGFGALMGYGNQPPARFRLQRVGGDTTRLPTASTCFNTLRLPDGYTGEA